MAYRCLNCGTEIQMGWGQICNICRQTQELKRQGQARADAQDQYNSSMAQEQRDTSARIEQFTEMIRNAATAIAENQTAIAEQKMIQTKLLIEDKITLETAYEAGSNACWNNGRCDKYGTGYLNDDGSVSDWPKMEQNPFHYNHLQNAWRNGWEAKAYEIIGGYNYPELSYKHLLEEAKKAGFNGLKAYDKDSNFGSKRDVYNDSFCLYWPTDLTTFRTIPKLHRFYRGKSAYYPETVFVAEDGTLSVDVTGHLPFDDEGLNSAYQAGIDQYLAENNDLESRKRRAKSFYWWKVFKPFGWFFR